MMNKEDSMQIIGIAFVLSILIILVFIPIINYHNKSSIVPCSLYEVSFGCEMSNNSTMIFELFVAGIFAIVLSIYFYRRQQKSRENRLTFAINRLQNLLYDLEPELQNLLGLFTRATRLWNTTNQATRDDFTEIINSRRNDIRRTLESIQGTLRISFDVLDPMLATRIDYFSRNGIEYCENNSPFDLLIEQFTILNNTRELILVALPNVERVNTDVFLG